MQINDEDMKIQCPKCKSTYLVDISTLKKMNMIFSCKRCHARLRIARKLTSDLKVVKECEHDWRYSVSDVNTIYYSVLRECDLCGDDDYLAIKKHELTKLFED